MKLIEHSDVNSRVRYIAAPTHVREVSLLGTADLEFWKEYLAKESLAPAARGGKAQILVIAASMKFRGVRFTELSFSVLVAGAEVGESQHRAFLIQAFNSCRLFAFCERVLFATPYSHGDCRVSVIRPVSMELKIGHDAAFRAELLADSSGGERQPSRVGEDGWEGIVFLPKNRRGQGRLFFARIAGHTCAYPFMLGEDRLMMSPSRNAGSLRALIDSQFTANEWLVRDDATHGKSKTCKRSDIV